MDERTAPGTEQAEAAVGSLQSFLNDIARWPLLTAAEEIELAKRIERGDPEARRRMINSNLRLVVSVARRYQGLGLPLPDLIQEGIFGLMRAVEKFDWRRGYRFSTYATCWIRQSIQRGIGNRGPVIRVPAHAAERDWKLTRAAQRLTATLGRAPTDEEVAAGAGLPLAAVAAARKTRRTVVSLDSPIGEAEQVTLGELIGSDEPGPGEEVLADAVREVVRKAVATLPERERSVVELRYGLGASESLTYAQVGRRLGVTRERARQLESQALRRLALTEELAAVRVA